MPNLLPTGRQAGPSGGWGMGVQTPMSTVQLITCPALSRRRGDEGPR